MNWATYFYLPQKEPLLEFMVFLKKVSKTTAISQEMLKAGKKRKIKAKGAAKNID